MKKISSIILSIWFISSMSLMVFATITSAGGGTWDYGANSTICWSKYTHSNLRHGSTAINGDDESDEDDGVDAGDQSWAEVSSTDWATHLFRRNRAYWHRCGIDKKCGYTQD